MLVLNNVETAKYVRDLLLEISGKLNEFIEGVQDTCSPEAFLNYRRQEGKARTGKPTERAASASGSLLPAESIDF